MENEKNIIWVDTEHPDVLKGTFKTMEEGGSNILLINNNFDEQKILNLCDNRQLIVVHCGTLHPMVEVKDLFLSIKERFPKMRIGLQTNAKHPFLEDLVDFYIEFPTDPDEIVKLVNEQINISKAS